MLMVLHEFAGFTPVGDCLFTFLEIIHKLTISSAPSRDTLAFELDYWNYTEH